MSALKDQLGRLVDRTEKEITALFGRWQRGEISEDQFEVLGATVLARARARGVTLADLGLSVLISQQLGPTSPIGFQLPDDEQLRLRKSVRSVLDLRPDSAGNPEQLTTSRLTRMQRLARDTSAEAVIYAASQIMQRREVQGGWVRETDSQPCVMCMSLADGVVRSWSVQMKRHTGCTCFPAPSFA